MDTVFVDRMRRKLRALQAEQRERIASLAAGFDVEMTASVGELSSIDNHTSDLGNETMERQKDLGLLMEAKRTFGLIEDALRRVDEGTYGLCAGCGRPIAKERLEALPYAAKCVTCQAEDDEDLSFYRPAEEAALWPPFGRAAYGRHDIDRDDAWEIVARHGTANTPQDTPEAYDADDDGTDKGNG